MRLALEVRRLLFEPDGPIDLLMLHNLIGQWFDGVPFYEDRGGLHPPGVNGALPPHPLGLRRLAIDKSAAAMAKSPCWPVE